MRKAAPHFPKSMAKGSNPRQTHGPGELDVFDVLANDLPVVRWQFLEPFANRFPAACGAVKPRRESLRDVVHGRAYHFWHVESIRSSGVVTHHGPLAQIVNPSARSRHGGTKME